MSCKSPFTVPINHAPDRLGARHSHHRPSKDRTSVIPLNDRQNFTPGSGPRKLRGKYVAARTCSYPERYLHSQHYC